MAYEKTNWIDHVVDSETGEIIQQGTRFTAQKMNNIEKGISETRSEVDGLKGLDGKIKVELIPKEGLDVDQVDGLHVDDTNSGSSEEEKNALWSAKKVKEITDELGSAIGQMAYQLVSNAEIDNMEPITGLPVDGGGDLGDATPIQPNEIDNVLN